MSDSILIGPAASLDEPNGRYFERFGIGPEVLRRVMSAALSRGASDCDLYFEHSHSTSVGLTDGKVNRASTQVDLGMGVRARCGDEVGYAYTEDLSVQSMLSAAATAAEIAAAKQQRDPVDLQVLGLPQYYPVQRRWETVGVAERVPLVRSWEEDAFSLDPRIEKVQAYVADSERVVMVVRPDGRLAQDYQPMCRGFVVCTAQDNGVRESASYNLASRAGLEFFSDKERTDRMVRKAVERTLFLLTAGRPPAGELPVVMAPGASGILLHEAIGHGLEADFNRKGVSIFAESVGKSVAPDFVTVVDDGTIESARGAINVDDEGNATERTVLVQDGVLQGFLQDEISAAHFGVAATGSGRRESFRHAPMPRMRSTYMESGPHDPEDIIRSVKKGIYCSSFSNGQVQIGAGDFAFYMKQGYLIEDGKLTQPIKDANIIGNGPDALARVEMVGNDLQLDEGGWTCGKE
ncbi:MAG: TldD/PmbA family protein, partial [Myxococcota bacterium]|nr:TldD/PmbA family protein [Myxococcota bacterium]